MEHPELVTARMRANALALTPEDLGLSRDTFPDEVWGLLMETGFPDGAFSLVVLADGTTSLYFSSGGGIIGGGRHDGVRDAGATFLAGANHFLPDARPAAAHPLPGAGQVTFYFLTYGGVLSYSAPEVELGEGRDRLSPLFYAGHEVIARLREIQESAHGPAE